MIKNSIPPHGTNNIIQATAERDERIKQILDEGVAMARITPSDVERFRALELEFKKLNTPDSGEGVEVRTGEGEELSTESAADTYTLMQQIISKALG